MKKIISCLLLIVMIFTLTTVTGCEEKSITDESAASNASDSLTQKTDAELIVGKWEYDYDFGKNIAEGMTKDENIGKYVPENVSFKVKLNLTFTADGIFETGMKDDVEEAMDNFMINLYTQVFTDYFEDTAKQYSMTTEELLALLTTDFEEDIHIETIEDYVKYSFGNSNYKETLPEVMTNKKCKYSLADGKLYTSENSDEEINEKEYVTYTVTENELVFTGDSTGEYTENYPLTFHKAA